MAPKIKQPVLSRSLRKSEERLSPLGVIAPPEIIVESPKFSGSLAMLFSYVKDRKVELMDVPLFPICEAYFEYLIRADLKDLDEAAAALVALAYLLERKAWALLPMPEEEPEAEEPGELILPTAHEYEAVIEALKLWQEERDRSFFRPVDSGPDPYELPFVLENVQAADLARAFDRVLQRAQPATVEPLSRPRLSLSEQMTLLLGRMSAEWSRLDALLPDPFTREEAVYCFLALLELIRLGQVSLRIESQELEFSLSGGRR